jgi:hypothetical protein
MEKRKADETDAQYIARLETSRNALKANNDKLTKDHRRLYETIGPAAGTACFVLRAAAEAAGVSDRPDIVATANALEKLQEIIWHDDHVEVPKIDKIPFPIAEQPSDLMMMLKSSVEAGLCDLDMFRDERPLIYPEINSDADLREVAYVIWDALDSAEFSRRFLRYDLRSGMYERCFQQIGQAARRLYQISNQSDPA